MTEYTGELKSIFSKGRTAFLIKETKNPYSGDPERAQAWRDGFWYEGQQSRKRGYDD